MAWATSGSDDDDTINLCGVVLATVKLASNTTGDPLFKTAVAVMWCVPSVNRFDSNGIASRAHERHER